MMHISGFTKTTLLDYPEHLAATIFTGGCNFRCPFCQNSQLIGVQDSPDCFTEQEVLTTLDKRRRILEGVCITGGEPTIHKELPTFIHTIKDFGLKVKLDTNGTNPSMLEYLLEHSLIDYVAMDIKNSKSNYGKVIGLPDYNIHAVEESVELLRSSSIPYEFRTTLVKEFHKEADIIEIGQWLHGCHAYYLQSYEESEYVLDKSLHAHSKKTILSFQSLLKQWIPNTYIRGIN